MLLIQAVLWLCSCTMSRVSPPMPPLLRALSRCVPVTLSWSPWASPHHPLGTQMGPTPPRLLLLLGLGAESRNAHSVRQLFLQLAL